MSRFLANIKKEKFINALLKSIKLKDFDILRKKKFKCRHFKMNKSTRDDIFRDYVDIKIRVHVMPSEYITDRYVGIWKYTNEDIDCVYSVSIKEIEEYVMNTKASFDHVIEYLFHDSKNENILDECIIIELDINNGVEHLFLNCV